MKQPRQQHSIGPHLVKL